MVTVRIVLRSLGVDEKLYMRYILNPRQGGMDSYRNMTQADEGFDKKVDS